MARMSTTVTAFLSLSAVLFVVYLSLVSISSGVVAVDLPTAMSLHVLEFTVLISVSVCLGIALTIAGERV